MVGRVGTSKPGQTSPGLPIMDSVAIPRVNFEGHRQIVSRLETASGGILVTDLVL